MNTNKLQATIVGVVSNHCCGGVRDAALNLGIPFTYAPNPTAADYQHIVNRHEADFVALSGWLKKVEGLPTGAVFNIHPGPLPEYGGPGMYGQHVHEAVIADFRDNRITHTAVTMHFVNAQYDEGPVVFRAWIPIVHGDTPQSLAARVNKREHYWQPYITDLIVNGHIRSGPHGDWVDFPLGYQPEVWEDVQGNQVYPPVAA